jgi:hypothetical protein
MPSAGRDDLPERELAGDDVTSALKDLPDGRCQARHWGYLFSGRIVVDYGDREEVITGGQAYHVEPGHRLRFEEDCEALEFTPTEELARTLEAMQPSNRR